MLKLTIEKAKNRIERQFENNLYDKVRISNKDTFEKTNIEYCLLPEIDDIKYLTNAPIDEEYVERQHIIKKSNNVKQFIINDKFSRRASFVNNYDGYDNHCISYFHFYIRDNMLSMNVYVRSMNFDTHFIFDNQTFVLAYFDVYNTVKEKYSNVNFGYIKINIFSLHKIKN